MELHMSRKEGEERANWMREDPEGRALTYCKQRGVG